MIFTETPLAGAYIVDIQRLEDERGFFAEGWKPQEAEALGITTVFTRSNMSFNKTKGTVRGLHAQSAPHAEAKLVRCVRGAIFDVMVDVREGSPTYGQWVGEKLTAENRRMLYIPEGFLHGFQTITHLTEVFYQVAGDYTPSAEVGARYDDPLFAIDWPEEATRIFSPKDETWPSFSSPLVSV